MNNAQIEQICKTYAIKSLFLTGSMARGEANIKSDVDLIVEFDRNDNPLNQYMDAKQAFETEFHRKVDLIEADAIKNPFFKKSLDADKVLLYEKR